MKKVIRNAVQEEVVYICDNCGKPAVSYFKFDFGYGSDHDMEFIESDFCNKCGNELRRYILRKYKKLKVNEFS